jgi:tetratricopeptide (TPR) repeat protein
MGEVTLKIGLMTFALLLSTPRCFAASGYINVRVENVQGNPVRNLQIGIENGVSVLTKESGLVQLTLSTNSAPNDWITIQLVHSPPGQDLAIVSPWDYRAQIPSFADKPENYLRVIVVQRGDRAALQSGAILAALAAKINKANAPKSTNPKESPPDPKEALLAVAKLYGLTPDDIDSAIRAWGAKTTDPYEAGLAALYERNYPKAISALHNSLEQREQKLEVDQKTVTEDQRNVADAAFFLGQSLYEEGQYHESVEAYKKSLVYRPDDPTVLNNLAESLEDAGDYDAAEALFRRALAINEKTLGPDHPRVAGGLDNLAELLQAKGNFGAAEPLARRALAIDERTLGPQHPHVAIRLEVLGSLLEVEGDCDRAEPLCRRALAIDEKALGPQHPHVAAALNNLASCLKFKGDLRGAELLYRRALEIDNRALGADHPTVAVWDRYCTMKAIMMVPNRSFDAPSLSTRKLLALTTRTLQYVSTSWPKF